LRQPLNEIALSMYISIPKVHTGKSLVEVGTAAIMQTIGYYKGSIKEGYTRANWSKKTISFEIEQD
jgi:hypothetical protein